MPFKAKVSPKEAARRIDVHNDDVHGSHTPHTVSCRCRKCEDNPEFYKCDVGCMKRWNRKQRRAVTPSEPEVKRDDEEDITLNVSGGCL